MKSVVLLLFLSNILFAFIIPSNTNELDINNHLFIYQDKTNKKNIQDIKVIRKWQKNGIGNYNLGYSNSTYWLKFDVSKMDDIKYFLSYKLVLIDNLDIYIVKNHNVIQSYYMGLKKAQSNKPINHRHYIVPLNLQKGDNYTIYIKLDSSLNSLQLPLFIYSKESFIEHKTLDSVIIIVYFAIVFLMFFYHIAIYMITKFHFYRYYIIYLSLLIITSSFTSGFLGLYIFPFGFNNIMIILMQSSGLLMIFSLIYMIKSISNSKKYYLIFEKIVDYLFFSLVILFLIKSIFLFFDYKLSSNISILMIIIFVSILTIVSYILFLKAIKKDVLAIFSILIWLPLIIVMILYVLNQMSYFVDFNKLEYIMRYLFIYESVFISIIMAYKVRLIESEKKKKEMIYIRQSKLASMGEMLNNIAHQWKQPLARINSSLLTIDTLYLQNKLNKEKLSKKLDDIEKETAYMSDVISSFSNFFHPDKKQELVNLYDLIVTKEEYIRKSFEKNIFVDIYCEDRNILTKAYKNEYEQVIFVILDNALDNFRENNIENPIIRIKIDKYDNKPRLIIENTGTQIKKENLEKIFDPYFSTKHKTPNRGIGLYMAKMLIENGMDKSLFVKNIKDGVQFTILG